MTAKRYLDFPSAVDKVASGRSTGYCRRGRHIRRFHQHPHRTADGDLAETESGDSLRNPLAVCTLKTRLTCSLLTSSFRLIAFAVLRLLELKELVEASDPTLIAAFVVVLTQVEKHYSNVASTIPCLNPMMNAVSTGFGAMGAATIAAKEYATGSGSGTGSHALRYLRSKTANDTVAEHSDMVRQDALHARGHPADKDRKYNRMSMLPITLPRPPPTMALARTSTALQATKVRE